MKIRSFVPLVWWLLSLTGFSTAHAAVTIVDQPRSAAFIVGDRAVFTIVATGNGNLSYQWMKNGTPISGATASLLTLNPIAFTDAASYTVAVTDADPTTVTSTAAGLSVNSAKAGDVDFSFNAGSSIDSEINGVAVQSDGKVLIAGQFTGINGMARGGIARLNSDGSSDYSFGYNLAGANNAVYAVVVQPDGRILIGGQFTTINGTPCVSITRLNSDGTLDATYHNYQGGIGIGTVNALALQSDGKVLVGGQSIRRLNADGTVDPTFANNVYGNLSTLTIQSDGKVIIGGQFNSVGGIARGEIARLNSDGTLDTTFGNGLSGVSGGNVDGVALQSDGKVIVVGQFFSVNGTACRNIARLNSDGTFDTTFGNGQTSVEQVVNAVAVQSNGQIVIAGQFSSVNGVARGNVARLNTDGSLDTTFGSTLFEHPTISCMALQSNGQVLLGGFIYNIGGTPCANIARLNTAGAVDTTFANSQMATSGGGGVMALQSDGRLLVGGYLSNGDGTVTQGISRLNSDGSTDYSFGNGLVAVDTSASALALQSDGKILISGTFTNVGGVVRHGIARLNADGTVDNSFGNGQAGVSNSYNDPGIYSLALQSDGRVLIGGYFSTVNGTARVGIARLNTDGTLDTTFGNGQAGVNGFNAVNSIAVQGDGKVLVGGSFTSMNGVARGAIARLNSDGTLDTSFGNGLAGASSTVGTIAVQSDGRAVIGGYFNTVNGTTRNYIARLNTDGTLDTTFGNGQSGLGNAAIQLALQGDGRILVVGDFPTVNGISRGYVARLRTDGSLDTTFGNGLAGANNLTEALVIQTDGKVIVSGTFSDVNGVARRYLARLQYSKVDADLAVLTISAGALSPAFSAGGINYVDNVTASSLTVTPAADDPAATIQVSVNGGSYAPVTSGSPSGQLSLSPGINTVNVQVTSADTTVVKTYTLAVSTPSNDAKLAGLTISNGALTPAFAPATLAYSATEPNALGSITATPIADQPNATITVNGTPTVSGQVSAPINLTVGHNAITIVAKAQDGATTLTYTINVLRMTLAMDTWSQTYFGSSTTNTAPAASFTGDGITNLEKFAFGMNPTVPGGPLLQYVGSLAGGGSIAANGTPVTLVQGAGGSGLGMYALFVRRDDYATAGIVYTPYFSGDLNSWQASTATPTILADNGSYQVVSVPYPSAVNGQNASFFRVQLSTAP